MTDSILEMIAKNIVSELLLDEEDWPLIVDAMKPIADSLAAMEADNAALRQLLADVPRYLISLYERLHSCPLRDGTLRLRKQIEQAMREGKG